MSYLSRDTIHITFDWSIVVKDYVTHETGGRPVTFCFCRVVAFLVEVRQVYPLYPVGVRSAPSQLPTEVVA